ncbi:MAG: DinB family protein [Mycobacteriales bacterium]
MNSCESCAYQYDDLPRAQLPASIREYAQRFGTVLAANDALALRRRPAPEVWSPLEYACHVRDVLAMQRERLERALAEDLPDFEPMDREGRVTSERYNEQDPKVVARQLVNAAGEYAGRVESLDDEQWLRGGVYHWPVTTTRTMDWVARHTVHELIHHLHDVDRGLTTPPQIPRNDL